MSSQGPETAQTTTLVAKPEFWRRTPPALFPSMMGFMGLGLAWRAAAGFEALSVNIWISYAILGLGSFLFMFILACYLSKISMRPSVILEELTPVPGRAGVSAMTLTILLFAAAMVPLSPTVARAALFLGLIGHSITAILILLVMARSEKGFVVSPAWHLSFVGFIVACLSAAPLGYLGLAQTILGTTVLIAALIYGVSLLQLSKSEMPPPLRPMLSIHLAPLSLFTSVAALLDKGLLAMVFATLAVGLAAVLFSRARYLTASGFSPLWGAFTFPVAALSVALFSIAPQATFFGWLALVPLVVVSILTPFVLVRVLMMWFTGALATKTGAALA